MADSQRKCIEQLREDITRSHSALTRLDERKHKPLVFVSFPTHRHATRRTVMSQHQEITRLRDTLLCLQRKLVQFDIPTRPVDLEEVMTDAHIAITEVNFGFFEADL